MIEFTPGDVGAPPRRAGAQTLDRGLQLLEAVVESSEPLSATQIAEMIGIHRTVAHRLAGTLAYRGYLNLVGNGKYSPGARIWALASRVVDVRVVARPFLEELAHQTGETVQLVLRAGVDMMFVDGLESPQALRVTSRIGRLLPAHATSVGKAWLAALDERQVRELYPNEELLQVTPETVASRSRLLLVLDEVRRRGFATNQGESEAGVGSVGVVVRDRSETVRAALSVAAPLSRIDPDKVAVYAAALRHTADEIGARLT